MFSLCFASRVDSALTLLQYLQPNLSLKQLNKCASLLFRNFKNTCVWDTAKAARD